MRKAVFLLVISFLMLGFTSFHVVRPELYFGKSDIQFKITAENGAVSYSYIEIESRVPRENTTQLYAKDKRKDDQQKSTFTYRLEFFCDSLNWCVSAMNHLNCPAVYSSNYIVSLRSDSLVYPYDMKVGDTLRHASASELIRATTQNERYVIIKNRKVAAKENITIAGETLSAFRIESKMSVGSIADYGALGKIPSEATYDFTEWFVPEKGIVKSQKKSSTGSTFTILN